MDTTTIEKIPFILKLDVNNKTVLETSIASQVFQISFETEDQSYLRDFFAALLKAEETKHFLFGFQIDPTVNNDTLKHVAESYIDSLNSELSKILDDMDTAVAQKNN
jgi:hypothetical protein